MFFLKFWNSSLSMAIAQNVLGIPLPRQVGGGFLLSYMIATDDAFPLTKI